MRLLLTIMLTIASTKAIAECHGRYKINKAAREANVSYLVLEPNVMQKFCLDIPKDSTGRFIELGSINLGNAQCSDVRMKVISPDGSKYRGRGSQPGTIGKFLPGRWVVRLTLKEGCTKYSLNAKWY